MQCDTRSRSKRNDTEVEQPRSDDSYIRDTGIPFSPVDCNSFDLHTPPVNSDLIVDNSNTCSQASVDSAHNINIPPCVQHTSADYSDSHTSSPVPAPPIHSPTVQPLELDDSSDSVETLEEDYICRCTNILCVYQTENEDNVRRDYNVNLYTCVKCSRPNGGSFTVCENCKHKGAHVRHEHHFIDYKTSKWFSREYVPT